jgi:hypothetical protein
VPLPLAQDRDDVLFAVDEGEEVRFVVVHLTWSGRTEPSPTCPRTQFFESLGKWIEWMNADHDDYIHGEETQQRL